MAHIYSDVNMNLLRHPGTFDVAKKFDVEAVKTSVRNILVTNTGEKLFKPDFGANLNDLLFELITPATKLLAKRRIIEEIQKWEPRVSITDVELNTDPDYNGTLTVTVNFFVIGIMNSDTNITINLSRVR